MKKRPLLLALASVFAAAGLSGCGGRSSAGGGASAISLVSYSVPKAAYDQLTGDFAGTSAGAGVTFETSFGGSGDQSRAVESGKKADIVNFSLEPDIARLVKSGQVAANWNSGPTKGIVTNSVVVLVVRKGNPKHIEGWDDIIKPGVDIVTPNPVSSGGARWNILAAWLHGAANGGDAAAKSFVTKVIDHTATVAPTARDATTAFTAGTGDVLISYENEAIFARQKGQKFDYVIPADTLLIESPVAVTTTAKPAATAFLDYLLSDAGQKTFVAKGFRSIHPELDAVDVPGAMDPKDPFPAPTGTLHTIADLGGWAEAKKFFATKDKDGSDGVITKILNASGKGA